MESYSTYAPRQLAMKRLHFGRPTATSAQHIDPSEYRAICIYLHTSIQRCFQIFSEHNSHIREEWGKWCIWNYTHLCFATG